MTFLHSSHTKTNELKPERGDGNCPSCHSRPGVELAINLISSEAKVLA